MEIRDGNRGTAEVLDLEKIWDPAAQTDDVDGLGTVSRSLELPDMEL